MSKLSLNRAISVATRNVLGEVFNLVLFALFCLEVAIEQTTQSRHDQTQHLSTSIAIVITAVINKRYSIKTRYSFHVNVRFSVHFDCLFSPVILILASVFYLFVCLHCIFGQFLINTF